MAASGYTPIILFNSTTTGNTPTTSNLAVGELAINVTDGKLFFNQSGTIKVLANATYATSVSTISFGTTGLTPSTATNGVVTVAGTLATTNGGTGLTSFTANGVVYASSTSALATGSGITYNGTTLTLANDASISGLTVGKGGGAVSNNTAVGNSALGSNTSGSSNSALGYYALGSNTTGYQSVAIGQQALNTNSTGTALVSVGFQALYSNTTASSNTAVGFQAGYSNTTGTYNNFSGYQAGFWNTTGSANTAVGYQSYAQSNTATGSNNTAIGYSALNSNTTASNNTAVGYQAGYSTIGGNDNTYLGRVAGYNNTTGTFNTFVGDGAGYFVSSGGKNSILGSYNGNQGGLDIRTASNYIVLSDGDGNPRVSIPTGTATATIPNATGTVMVSGNMPAFSAYASGNQNGLTSGTYVKAVFNTKIFDTNNNYDNTTNYRFTPTVAGYYQVNISYYLNGTGLIGQANIYKTGYLYQGTQYTNTTTTTSCIISISTIIYLNGSTDYIEGYVYGSTTAGTWQIQGAITYTYFNAVLVRGA